MRPLARLALAALVLSLPLPALAGDWITPDWPEGKEPQYKPVHLYWFEVKECPIIYRTEMDAPKDVDRATALARTSGYIYVYVDSKLVYKWAPQPKTEKQPEIPADPERVHQVDLTAALAAGRHALLVSAPAKGFVLDGGLYQKAKRLAPLATDGKWTVLKLPPTTVLEYEPVMKPDFRGEAAPVKAGEEWKADEQALAAAFITASAKSLRGDLDDVVWRLELLAKKGIALVDGEARAWGGPGRLDPQLLREVNDAIKHTKKTDWRPEQMLPEDYVVQIEKWTPQAPDKPESWVDLAVMGREEVSRAADRADALARAVALADETKALTLVSGAFAGPWPAKVSSKDDLAKIRTQMEKQLGHPLPRLNESRYDRLGWINHPGLTDSDIGRWGIRINPATGPAAVRAPEKWLFATDPGDAGEKELRWSIGYNVETQMLSINATKSWTADKRFAEYKGAAWYRARVHVPGEWAGGEVVLTVPVAGKERLWLNDKEITDRGSGEGKRTYKVPADLVSFGGENCLALRIAADGPERGLVGAVEVKCPALEAAEGKGAPTVEVLATPLAPCVVLTPTGDTLEVRHAGQAKLLVPGSGRPLIEGTRGRTTHENWALVWLTGPTPAATERPILLVFQKAPKEIACEAGLTKVKLAAAGERVIAVRPWAKAAPPPLTEPMKILSTCHFWSRAALAVPLNYMEITRVEKPGGPLDGISIDKVPAGPVLAHAIAYDYLETKDQWNTKPLRVAPLPNLCSYAIDSKFPTLALDGAQKVEVLQDGGPLAPYRGVADSDHVRYSYRVEPYPRFAGFTSWMFAGSDTGVPGNKRELELVAALGANSYRPQHNFCGELPPKGMWPESEKRTRLEILVDASSAVGVNYMNNIDQTLGRKPEEVRADYEKFMPRVYAHYEKIAKQLYDRPFWAVAYDLINEPFDHKHEKYNPAMKELTRRVRALDTRHLCYVEPCEAWGAIQQLALVEPTGDPLTVYSFHDYNFRLFKATDRWPTLGRDITNIHQMWLPAFVFQVKHGAAMHCGEFGGFAQASDDAEAQTILMNDFLRIFDQFGMHHHYYSGREIYERLADGSLRPSNVVRAYRAYFARPDFNAYYPRWPGEPAPPK